MPRYDGRPAQDDPLAYFLTWTTYGAWLPGEVVMNQLKAWCTRRLKEHGATDEKVRSNWWTQRGSKRILNDGSGMQGAILYVLEGQ